MRKAHWNPIFEIWYVPRIHYSQCRAKELRICTCTAEFLSTGNVKGSGRRKQDHHLVRDYGTLNVISAERLHQDCPQPLCRKKDATVDLRRPSQSLPKQREVRVWVSGAVLAAIQTKD